MSQINRKSVFGGFLWLFLEKSGAQLITFIVTIILARLLEPNVYGVIAIIYVFITVIGIFVDNGMASALIQKKNVDEVDYSSVFYTNIVFCTILYGVLFLVAPLIAQFYAIEDLALLIRVLGLGIVVSGVRNVQQAYVTRNMLFKRFFYSSLIGTIVSGVCGIIFAYGGYGVWALIIQSLVNQLVNTLILWLTVPWRPRLFYSIERVKDLFSYGWKLSLASLINVIYRDLRQLVIGKIYSTEDLAFYNRGSSFPNLFVTNINNAFAGVLFPVMSQKQNDAIAIRDIVRKSILLSTYVLFPLMMLLGICAEDFVRILLTDKWIFCVPYLQIFCFEYAFLMFITSNLNCFQSIGRSDIYLRNEILTKITGLIAIYTTARISVIALAFSGVFVTLLSVIINAISNKKIIDYGIIEQLKDVMPNFILTMLIGVVIYPIKWIETSALITLLFQVVLGLSLYIVISKYLGLESYYEVRKTIISLKNRG